jgi:hypothetical protein
MRSAALNRSNDVRNCRIQKFSRGGPRYVAGIEWASWTMPMSITVV